MAAKASDATAVAARVSRGRYKAGGRRIVGGTNERGAPMTDSDRQPIRPQVVGPQGEDEATAAETEGSTISEPSRLIRIASMTRAMLEEVRQAPLDEGGRRRLVEIHQSSLGALKEVLSEDLREELDEIFAPLSSPSPSESELRIAQAQLVGWLEGLFHGIQASLWSQQMAAQAQLEEMRQRKALEAGKSEQKDQPGLYL
jgi:hypothetical protein